jgi:hypothetical protein
MVAKLIGIGLATALMAGALATPAEARDDDAPFVSHVIGSIPGVTIGGVTSGGAQWTVHRGRVTLEDNGRLKVDVFGLLLVTGANAGTTGGIPEVAASLVCGGSGGSVAATSTPVGLGMAGNAEIRDDLVLPATCQGPVVIIRIFRPTVTPQLGNFIALTGITG